MNVKYPNVHVRLVGQDGNAFAIMGRVAQAMRSAGIGSAEIAKYHKECMSGDYDHLLQTCMRWVDCFDDGEEGLT
jgi:hypothetical protein